MLRASLLALVEVEVSLHPMGDEDIKEGPLPLPNRRVVKRHYSSSGGGAALEDDG